VVDVQHLFESSQTLHLVLGPDLTIIAVSDACLGTTTLTRDALIGRTLLEAFPEIADTRVKERDAMLEQLRARLRELEHEFDAFSHSVSHDLRAPLRSIQGFSQIVLNECSGSLPEEGREHLSRVCASTRRMSGLIDDLLTLSRIGRSAMTREPVDVSALARTVWRTLEKAESGRPVQFTLADGLCADADRHLLQIVLEHLLGNARKFTTGTAAPAVELGFRDDRGETVFFVRDNGAGFDQAYVGRLFAPFQRLHADRDFPGRGIGLAIVQRVIRRHGGRVWAEGAVGSGATIAFTLAAESTLR